MGSRSYVAMVRQPLLRQATVARPLSWPLILGSVLFVALFGTVAITATAGALHITSVFLASSAVCFCLSFLHQGSLLRDGRVRVTTTGPLRFLPSPLFRWLLFASSVALAAASVAIVASWVHPDLQPIFSGRSYRRGSGVLLVLGSVVFLATQIAAVSRRGGLIIDEAGVRWPSTILVRRVAWDDIVTVRAEARGKRATILTLEENRRTWHVYPLGFGSDPQIVAEVIEYFRSHPDERPLLCDGPAALRRMAELRTP